VRLNLLHDRTLDNHGLVSVGTKRLTQKNTILSKNHVTKLEGFFDHANKYLKYNG